MIQGLTTPIRFRWEQGKLLFISCLYSVTIVFLANAGLRFQQVFLDFKVETPAFTNSALKLCEFIYADYGWVAIVPIIATLPVVIARNYPTKRNMISNIVVVLLVLTFGSFVIAMFDPVITSGGGLSGPSK